MSDETHPDSPSGQPYSAPRQAWGGNADPRNLSYEPEGQSYLPPPDAPIYEDEPAYFAVPDVDPLPFPPTGGKKRSWFARHKFWTGSFWTGRPR